MSYLLSESTVVANHIPQAQYPLKGVVCDAQARAIMGDSYVGRVAGLPVGWLCSHLWRLVKIGWVVLTPSMRSAPPCLADGPHDDDSVKLPEAVLSLEVGLTAAAMEAQMDDGTRADMGERGANTEEARAQKALAAIVHVLLHQVSIYPPSKPEPTNSMLTA